MEQEENPQQVPPLPVLPRLDRLDRLVQLLEEKHSTSGRHVCNPVLKKTEQEEEDPRKSLTSALADVNQKGTLMDRLAMLENRVLKLSIEMDEGNTSRSSSSTVKISKIHGHDLAVSKGSTHDDDKVDVAHHTKEKEPPASIQERPADEECIATATTLTEERSGGWKREKRKGYSKWIDWFRCGREMQWNDDFGHNNRMDLR